MKDKKTEPIYSRLDFSASVRGFDTDLLHTQTLFPEGSKPMAMKVPGSEAEHALENPRGPMLS